MADDTKRMNVLYSSDDNYAQHMGVSIYSLLRHNAEFENIRLYVIDNDISPENRDKLREMVSRFSNAEIMFLPFLEWKEKLRLNMSWGISISSYARLFVGEMLPETVDRVLYADCDMIVCEPLRELWNTPLDGKVLAAVQDGISADTKAAVGLQAGMRYFNAGLLLIDLAEWRARKMGERCMSFIDGHGGNVVHHDQGVLNGVLMGDYVNLPIKDNLMTIHYMLSREKLLKYFHEEADFYPQEEIEAAKKARIHDYVMTLEEGYDTQVGERGVKLSGGQKQRISIARVFLKDPGILILDEATSALDNQTEMEIQQELFELAKGRTCIIVAHRLSTIKSANEIVVLTPSGIAERGSHRELMALGGIYANLYNYQIIDL